MDVMWRHPRRAVNPLNQEPSILTKLQRRFLVPYRLLVRLERWRGNRIADWLRRRIIANQPGLERVPRIANHGDDFILWIPPGWKVSAATAHRLRRLLNIRQIRSGAHVVSCDDWVPARHSERLRWREKGQLDSLLDEGTGFADGPLWIKRELLARFGWPPDEPLKRPAWRRALFEGIDPNSWAHVPLPLAVGPRVNLAPASPGIPKSSAKVSVMIPSGGFYKSVDGRKTMLIRHCLTTLLQRTDYRNLEIILVDGGELSLDQLNEFERLVESSLGLGRWRHVSDHRAYSYSLRMNLAASLSSGEYLLQLNDDTEILESKAIGSMLALAEKGCVGVVGGLLLYPGGRVQHSGVAINNLAPSHPWSGFWPARLPLGLRASPRQFQAVTAAVCLCSRKLWNELNGLREDLPVNYGDVDFCLRARELGQKVVLDPASCWTHFESASRLLDSVPAELPRFRELWTEKLGGKRCIDLYTSRWRELGRPFAS